MNDTNFLVITKGQKYELSECTPDGKTIWTVMYDTQEEAEYSAKLVGLPIKKQL